MASPHAKSLARVMKVLAVNTRLDIVRLLKGQALCVSALAARLDVTQGAVSQHLRIMRDADLVIDEKRGYYVHYRLNEATLAAWREQVDELLDTGTQNATHPREHTQCAATTKRTTNARNRRT